jgi:hypothetical protein
MRITVGPTDTITTCCPVRRRPLELPDGTLLLISWSSDRLAEAAMRPKRRGTANMISRFGSQKRQIIV